MKRSPENCASPRVSKGESLKLGVSPLLTRGLAQSKNLQRRAGKLQYLTIVLLLVAVNALGASPYIVVLGTAQDAGVPQMGCDTPFCRRAWNDSSLRQTVSSIALIDPETKSRWIFDA